MSKTTFEIAGTVSVVPPTDVSVDGADLRALFWAYIEAASPLGIAAHEAMLNRVATALGGTFACKPSTPGVSDP